MERPENSLEEQSCEDCELYPMPFQFVRSLWRYSGTVEDLVCSYKYRDGLNLRSFFVDSLLSEINKGAFPISSRYSWSLILALPSTQESLARRGYSPVGEIAKRLALTLKLSYSPLALWTTKNYAPQATLRKEERLLNIWRKYKANPAKVRGQSVLLLDDVITTGASIAGATVALQAAGARSVDILSLARSDLFSLIRRELSEKIRGKALSGRKRDEGYDN
jgi:predicted amidophosphoribosyltransferase